MNLQPMTQYNVMLDDTTPGGVGKLADVLSRERIRFGSAVTASVGRGISLQFLAKRDSGLRRRLEKKGMRVREDQVFQLEMPNHQWEFYKLAKALTDAGISVLSLHSASDGDTVRMVLAVDQAANAVDVVARLGYNPDYSVV
ncbi:MAG: hypothetical protein HY078_00540 [Elusimicrobia bacterium]|nr:hypothetical protein [Elusimicrobiota bacterium]